MRVVDDYSKRESGAVRAIKEQIPPELQQHIISVSKNQFAILTESNAYPDYYKVSAVDGPGTKPLLAIAMDKFNTIGIDVVAMVANDVATWGNVVLDEFINYFPCQQKIEEEKSKGKIIAGQIMEGIVQGCLLAGIETIGKGETASVDEMLGSPKPGYGFDVGASLIGFIKKSDVSNKMVKPGYLILGFGSSGPHCNGYTALRHQLLNGDFEERPEIKKFYQGRFSLDDEIPGTVQKIGEALLIPTLIYSSTMREIGKNFPYIHGVNITGYGLKNFNRLKFGIEYHIIEPFSPKKIFSLYKEETGESDEKMYERFNMGLGFAIAANPNDLSAVLKIAERYGEKVKIVGEVRESKTGKDRTILHKDGREIIFEEYQ